MGKNKKRHRPQIPDFNNPVCPTCARFDQLVEESSDDDPMYECLRCRIRFMYEDTSTESADDDDDDTGDSRDSPGVMPGMPANVTVKQTKVKDTRVYSSEPVFGEMEELTSAVAKPV